MSNLSELDALLDDFLSSVPTPAPSMGTLVSAAAPAIPSSTWKDEFMTAVQSDAWRPVIEINRDGRTHIHTPMPPASRITSVQLGLIDRGARPTKTERCKSPYRYKLCVEMWTVPHDQIVRHKSKTCWRRFAQLRPESAFVSILTGNMLNHEHITPEFKDWVLDLLNTRRMNTGMNDLYGVFHDNNGGWNYYNEHFVWVKMDDSDPVVDLYRNRELIKSIPLSPQYAGSAFGVTFPDGSRQTFSARENF